MPLGRALKKGSADNLRNLITSTTNAVGAGVNAAVSKEQTLPPHQQSVVDLRTLLGDKRGYEVFERHLGREFALENLTFWNAARGWMEGWTEVWTETKVTYNPLMVETLSGITRSTQLSRIQSTFENMAKRASSKRKGSHMGQLQETVEFPEGLSGTSEAAWNLFKTFVFEGAPLQVNVSSRQKDAVRVILEESLAQERVPPKRLCPVHQ